MVCKTIIRRFESGRRLQLSWAGVLLLRVTSACSDPANPPPARPNSPSTAIWMEWRALDAPVRGPVARVVDLPGGPADRLVADPDVTTFFNDRFHPIFALDGPAQPVGTVQFFDGCGCPLTVPLSPGTAAELIAAANTVIVTPAAHACPGAPFRMACAGTENSPADEARPGL